MNPTPGSTAISRPISQISAVILIAMVLLAGCTGSASPGDGGKTTTSSAQSPPPANDTDNSGGGDSSDDDSTPPPDDPPPDDPPASVSFSTSSTLVSAGSSVALNWSSSDADSCTASGGWTGPKALGGSEIVGPLNQDTDFTLSCSGSGGGGVQQLTVRIDPGNGASVALIANPTQIATGGFSTLTWNSTGADTCTASGAGWNGDQALSGNFTVGPLSTTTTYQLTCDGPTGSAVGLVGVEVLDKTLRWQAPTQNVDGTPLTDLSGYVIYWGTSSRSYIDNQPINSAATTEWEVTAPPGSYYFAMTAVDADGNESGYSNEVFKVIP